MIWIIGNKGMLGQELSREFINEGIEFIGTDRDVSILEKNSLSVFAENNKPSWIINCSAYTAVDKAEEEKELAYQLNCEGAANIAQIAKKIDASVIHISTDYVFNGVSSYPIIEEAETDPQSVYGKTKLAGENEIMRITDKYFIIRTAWLYGQFGPNFVFTMLKLIEAKENIKVINDQFGSPTWTKILTGLIKTIILKSSKDYGIYHLSGEGQCTWFDFANEIYKLAKKTALIESDCKIDACKSDEFPAKAKRPEFSILSKEKVKKVFTYNIPCWQESLSYFFKEYTTVNSKDLNNCK